MLHRPIETHSLITPCNPAQKQLVKSIKRNTITMVKGFPGTGKTLLALMTAIQLYNNDFYGIEKIVYCRANVGIEEERETGTLPGERVEKLWHLAYPLLDNLPKIVSKGDAEALLRDEIIEISPVAELRGRTFDNTIVIVDEAQNVSYAGLKTILTRVGHGSRMIIMGDPEQADLSDRFWVEYGDEVVPALTLIYDLLWGLEDVGHVEFTIDDIVRHPIIGHILARL